MLQSIRNLFGLRPKPNYTELVKQGAVIIDFRSKSEFSCGHIRNSFNIPVDTLGNNLTKLKDKNKPIIFCCASGMRSASAKNILKSNGYTQVYNGGAWSSLQNKL